MSEVLNSGRAIDPISDLLVTARINSLKYRIPLRTAPRFANSDSRSKSLSDKELVMILHVASNTKGDCRLFFVLIMNRQYVKNRLLSTCLVCTLRSTPKTTLLPFSRYLVFLSKEIFSRKIPSIVIPLGLIEAISQIRP